MKLKYAIFCTLLTTAAAYGTDAERIPAVSTHPAPPASTRCPPAGTQPPAAATQVPPPDARRGNHLSPPVQQNQDEKVIPGEPLRPRPPVQQLPPPPCGG